jgi:hypothetical protein
MTEETKEKDHFILYTVLVAIVFVSVILAVKSSETDKFSPIRAQVAEELKLMNIRVLKDYE